MAIDGKPVDGRRLADERAEPRSGAGTSLDLTVYPEGEEGSQ